MAVYPSTNPYPQYEHVTIQRWKTLISNFDSGKEQRRKKYTYPQYDVTLIYNGITSTQKDNVLNFFEARQGAYEDFYYYIGKAEEINHHWTNVYVAIGNSSSTTFNFPGIVTSDRATIFVNGTVLSTTNWSMTSTNGANGEDILLFSSNAPSTASIITAEFSGYYRNRCRFKDDEVSITNYDKGIFSIKIDLKGLTPDT